MWLYQHWVKNANTCYIRLSDALFEYYTFVYMILQDICQVLPKSLLQKEVNNELKSQWCNVWHWLSIVNIFKRVLHLHDRDKNLLFKPENFFFDRGGIGGGPSQTNQLPSSNIFCLQKKKENINSFFFKCVFFSNCNVNVVVTVWLSSYNPYDNVLHFSLFDLM